MTSPKFRDPKMLGSERCDLHAKRIFFKNFLKLEIDRENLTDQTKSLALQSQVVLGS